MKHAMFLVVSVASLSVSWGSVKTAVIGVSILLGSWGCSLTLRKSLAHPKLRHYRGSMCIYFNYTKVLKPHFHIQYFQAFTE